MTLSKRASLKQVVRLLRSHKGELSPAGRAERLSASRRLRTLLTLAASVLLSSSTGVFAAGLFEPLSSAEAASFPVAVVSPVNVRDRLVRLDYRYMESNLAPLGADMERSRVRRAPTAASIDVELFPDLSVTIERTRLEKARGEGGGFIWSGSMTDDAIGDAVLVVSGGQITGRILYERRLFRITPVSGAVHRIVEIDASKFPGDVVLIPPRADRGIVEGIKESAQKTEIRILMPYTKKAASESGHIVQDAKLAIALGNRSLRNAGVRIRYVLAGTMKVPGYAEPTDFSDTLHDLTYGTGGFDAVHAMRDSTQADLVALLRVGLQYCGIGWLNEDPDPASEQWGFSVTSIECVSDDTVSHEVGHNQGLRHDRFVEPKAPKSRYNYGFVNKNARIRSVMAYTNKCSSCTKVLMYSSSKKKYKGHKLGIKQGKRGAADAARTLDENRSVISNFR